MTRDQFYQNIEDHIVQLISKNKKRPLFIGLNAPQGAGKTSLCSELKKRFKIRGLKLIAISIDDFYLTRNEQQSLANQHPHNPYLQLRGYPGTHDIQLGTRVLESLKNIDPKYPVRIPRYDKSALSGLGDRASENTWTECGEPLDVVILEGWMLGFHPSTLNSAPDENWDQIDRFLRNYSQWLRLLDAFVHLKALDPKNVLEWRLEAEQKMRATGKAGMSDEQIKAYAQLFIPAYERYQDSPVEMKSMVSDYFSCTIGSDRLPIHDSL